MTTSDQAVTATAFSRESRWASKALLVATLVLTTVPILLLVWLIDRYAVNMPNTDAWDTWLSPYVFRHQMSFEEVVNDLWRFRNGAHRQFVPRLVVYLLADLTHLHMITLLYVGVLFSVVLLAFLVHGFMRYSTWRFRLVVAIPMAMLLFIPTASRYWIHATLPGTVIPLLFSVASFWFLSRPSIGYGSFGGALVCAVLSAWSLGSGNITLLVGGLGLFATPYRKVRFLATWAAVSAVVLTTYAYDFLVSSSARGSSLVFSPLDWPGFISAFVAAPINPARPREFAVPIAIGMTALVMFVTFVLFMLRRDAHHRARTLFWSLLALWVVLVGLQIGIGRHASGLTIADSVRYGLYGSLFWISFVALCFYVVTERDASGDGKGRVWTRAAAICLIAVAVLYASATVRELRQRALSQRSSEYVRAAECVRTHTFEAECAALLEGVSTYIQASLPFAYESNLAFVDISQRNPARRYEFRLPAEDMAYERIDVAGNTHLAFEGRSERYEWSYTYLGGARYSYDVGLWVRQTDDRLTDDEVGYKVELWLNDDLVITEQRRVTGGEPPQWLHVEVPEADRGSAVGLVFESTSGLAGDTNMNVRSSYWLDPRFTIQLEDAG